MSGLKLFLVILLFVIYQLAVWVPIREAAPPAAALPICVILAACGNTLLALYFVVTRQRSPNASRAPAPEAWTPVSARGPGQTSPEIRWDTGVPAAPAGSSPGAQTEFPAAFVAEAQSRLGRTLISDLPVHLVIGTEGSGKTGLLHSSGIPATLLASQSNPARNAWLAYDSLLLEQGGPNSWADAVESRNLLEALGPRPKLRGVIVCCPIQPFLGVQDARAIGALATRVQAHLREIGAVAGGPVTFYLIFTKCDAIPFFGDYSGVLADAERQQVLGSALPEMAGQPREMQTGQITEAFNALYVNLAAKRLTLLSRTGSAASRGGIYEFPREMRRMRSGLVQFLADIVQPDPMQPCPRLGGFYFTGSATDGDAASPRNPLFASDLFRQILTPVQTMAPGLPHAAAAFAGPVRRDREFLPVSVIALVLLGACFYSGYRNYTLMRNARAAVLGCPPLPQNSMPSVADLERIDALRGQVTMLVRYRNQQPPIAMRLGLYSGDEVLRPLRQVYFRRFQQYFLRPVGHQLEAEFAAMPRKRSASYPYETMRAHVSVYRMISGFGPAGDLPAEELASWLLLIWRDSPQWNARADLVARANFAFYSEELRGNRSRDDLRFRGKNPELVQRASDYLHYFKTAGQQGP